MHPAYGKQAKRADERPPSSRPLKACENCRQRKIKCPGPDGGRTNCCYSCIKSGRPCTFRPRTIVKRRQRIESRIRDVEERIASLTTRLHIVSEESPKATSSDVSQHSEANSVKCPSTVPEPWLKWSPDQQRRPSLRISFEQLFLGLNSLGPILGTDLAGFDTGASRLLVHWEEEAVDTVGPPQIRNIFKTWGTELVSRATYLFHTVCAFSALHLRQLQRHEQAMSQTLEQLFDYHFQLALVQYSEELSKNVIPDTMDALFAACMLFALMAYATRRHEAPEGCSTGVDDASPDELAWLTSQTGFTVIKEDPVLQPYIPRSIWHTLLNESKYHADSLNQPLNIENIGLDWLTICHPSGDDYGHSPYACALKYLSHIKEIDPEVPENFSYFICFPGHMSARFKELVKARDNTASLFLLNWLTKMYAMDYWWSKDCVYAESQAIISRMDAQRASDPLLQRLLEPSRAAFSVPPRRV